MIPQRTILRASQRAGQPLRSPVLRSTIQRHFASGEGVKLTGPADNAFNRERQAVKQHAAATSGTSDFVSRVQKEAVMCETKTDKRFPRPLAEAINLVRLPRTASVEKRVQTYRDPASPFHASLSPLSTLTTYGRSIGSTGLMNRHWRNVRSTRIRISERRIIFGRTVIRLVISGADLLVVLRGRSVLIMM